MKPDSASATAAEERIIRQAEEIIRRLEEKNTMLRLKLYLVRMEKMTTSRCRHRSKFLCSCSNQPFEPLLGPVLVLLKF